jgi:hypothetical protein
MTSQNPYESAAGQRAAQQDEPRGERGTPLARGDGPAPEMDPVHPTPRPKTAVGVAAAMQPRSAAELGTPAVLEHRIVALEAGDGAGPLIVHTVDGRRTMMPLEARVWARAGRLTVIAHDGSELKLTVLGPQEAEDLRLGERWPAGEPEGRAKRMAAAAMHDVGDVLTLPAWLARTARLSGQRNVALHALVCRLRKASPGTAVFYGQTVGFDHHRPEQERPYDHRGIVGREGYPTEL